MLGSLTGQLLDDAQTTLHVDPSPISDRTVLDGRSTRSERTRGRNARKPFWRVREPIWHRECLFLNRNARDERANRRTEHGERPTDQIKYF